MCVVVLCICKFVSHIHIACMFVSVHMLVGFWVMETLGGGVAINPFMCLTQVTRRANSKKRLSVLYIVEHPNQEGDTCIDWTSQYCWTNGWNCLWRGHSVDRNRPLNPAPPFHVPFF